MDTKSKNSKKWLGNLLCILVVVVLAAGTIICYPRLRMGAEERMNVYRDRAEAETSANLGEDQPIEAERRQTQSRTSSWKSIMRIPMWKQRTSFIRTAMTNGSM